MLTGIAHINLTVPTNSLDEAEEFYSKTLGMQRVPVPVLQKVRFSSYIQSVSCTHQFRKQDRLAWYAISCRPSRHSIPNIQSHDSQAPLRFDITPNGQQVHIAFGPDSEESSRHPCFRVESQEALLKLQKRVFEHFEAGGKGAPRAADKPGAENSGMLIHDFV